MKKRILLLMTLLILPCTVHAGDITGTGMSQKDLVQFLDNTKSLVNDLAMRAKNQCLNSAGLTTNGTQTKVGASGFTYAVVNGSMVAIGSSTSITGAIGSTSVGTTTPYQIYIFTVNSSGTITSTEGTQAAGTNTVVLPNIPENQAMLGFMWLRNGSTTAFLPGTHTLTAGGIGTTFVNTQGMVDFVPGSGTTNSLSLTGL